MNLAKTISIFTALLFSFTSISGWGLQHNERSIKALRLSVRVSPGALIETAPVYNKEAKKFWVYVRPRTAEPEIRVFEPDFRAGQVKECRRVTPAAVKVECIDLIRNVFVGLSDQSELWLASLTERTPNVLATLALEGQAVDIIYIDSQLLVFEELSHFASDVFDRQITSYRVADGKFERLWQVQVEKGFLLGIFQGERFGQQSASSRFYFERNGSYLFCNRVAPDSIDNPDNGFEYFKRSNISILRLPIVSDDYVGVGFEATADCSSSGDVFAQGLIFSDKSRTSRYGSVFLRRKSTNSVFGSAFELKKDEVSFGIPVAFVDDRTLLTVTRKKTLLFDIGVDQIKEICSSDVDVGLFIRITRISDEVFYISGYSPSEKSFLIIEATILEK